jgi:hypothetical protein
MLSAISDVGLDICPQAMSITDEPLWIDFENEVDSTTEATATEVSFSDFTDFDSIISDNSSAKVTLSCTKTAIAQASCLN